MTDKEPFSPQGWLDWQLKDLEGYKDLNKLNRLLISAEAAIDLNSERIEEHVPLVAAGLIKRDGFDECLGDLEWALKVKALIQKEIREFPPLPVLPPPGPLEKISGVIEDVTYTKAMACFEAEAYSTMRDEAERKRKQDNAGAAIAMVAQALSGTAPHAMINDGKAKKLKCLYVKGKIGGKAFSGWFGMTNIRPGDFVEMAVVPSGDGYLAYAIANPEQRTVSFTPKCDIGRKTVNFRQGLYIWLAIGAVFYAIGLAAAPSRWLVTTIIYIGVCLALSQYLLFKIRKENASRMALFDEICDTLNLAQYKVPGFRAYTKKKADELKQKGDCAATKEGRAMPRQSVPSTHEYFFYY